MNGSINHRKGKVYVEDGNIFRKPVLCSVKQSETVGWNLLNELEYRTGTTALLIQPLYRAPLLVRVSKVR